MQNENYRSCIEKVASFIDYATGGVKFEQLEKLFQKALDENPVFAEITQKGAFGKNIIVLLGGRGCGKTLAIRYFKYHLLKEGMDFIYQEAQDLQEGKSLDSFRKKMLDVENKLKQDPAYKVAVAIDDAVEADEAARSYLKNYLVPLVLKYSGRFKLILAAQSERVTSEGNATLIFLRNVLGRAPHAEMFFGEHPEYVIETSFKRSYTSRSSVILLRRASIVNLDAYWSSLRSLKSIEKLAEVIVKIMEFYLNNIEESCNELIDEVKKYKHGLALLALSSLPKIAGLGGDDITKSNVIIEYYGTLYPDLEDPVASLNGLGIAHLLRRFLQEEKVRNLAEKAEKFYEDLRTISTDVRTEEVKKVILDACEILPYTDVIRSGSISVLGINLPQESKGKRRKYGPRIDVIHIIRETTRGQKEATYLVIHNLKIDERGYVATSSLNKLKELLDKVKPKEIERRYLIVIIPTRKHIRAIYKYVKPINVGADVRVVLADTLSSMDKAIINKLSQGAEVLGSEAVNEFLFILYKIVLGTVLFNLRDHRNQPQFIYYLLPTIPKL